MRPGARAAMASAPAAFASQGQVVSTATPNAIMRGDDRGRGDPPKGFGSHRVGRGRASGGACRRPRPGSTGPSRSCPAGRRWPPLAFGPTWPGRISLAHGRCPAGTDATLASATEPRRGKDTDPPAGWDNTGGTQRPRCEAVCGKLAGTGRSALLCPGDLAERGSVALEPRPDASARWARVDSRCQLAGALGAGASPAAPVASRGGPYPRQPALATRALRSRNR